MNLANWITMARIILAPICVGFLFLEIPGHELVAAIVFILAGLTDALDGYVARIRKETTTFGKSFDPLADKILITSVLFVLAYLGHVHWIIVWIILGREILITILRHFAGKKGLVVSASIWGKAKTFIQILAISVVMVSKFWPLPYADYLLWLAVALTVWSGIDYLWRWRGAFRGIRGNHINLIN